MQDREKLLSREETDLLVESAVEQAYSSVVDVHAARCGVQIAGDEPPEMLLARGHVTMRLQQIVWAWYTGNAATPGDS